MLTFYAPGAPGVTATDLHADTLPSGVNWIDALNATKEETAFLERVLRIVVPSIEKLSEIERSSRLYRDNGNLFLSFPTVYRDADAMPRTTPIGFVLSRDILLMVRFEELKCFHQLNEQRAQQTDHGDGGIGPFIMILEAIIDHVADVLEHVGAELDATSNAIFGSESAKVKLQRPRQDGIRLREILHKVGRSGDLTSKISESLLGMARMIPFVASNAARNLSSATKDQLESLKQDIGSLNDYETHLTDKTQFLLDTTLGLANIDQNNVFRVLTVVSVIGIPPTFIASMYGMNFKNIPEYDWSWGYQYGLVLILCSAIIPMLWFKWRGWW